MGTGMSQTDPVLERFHRALIEEIQTQRPEYLSGPFTVAEIYQNLVPYGSHRDRIGVEMNGDYEDALLRLLAGEGDYLILESEPALRDLKAELETPDPNTGLYREYAAVDVRLNQDHLDLSPSTAAGGTDMAEDLVAPDPVPMADLAPVEAAEEGLVIVPPGVDVFEDEAAGQAAPPEASDESSRPTACLWCRGELPVRDNLNFCPFCGTDVRVVPCSECREEVEPGWRFCIACGTEVSR
jgi:hypothetical protein